MGRAPRIRSRAELEEKWADYKKFCDSQKVPVYKISRKTERMLRRTRLARISYTIEGFCVWVGISRSAFYETYGAKYPDILTRMREECEFDVRRKFETGELPGSLAALWMSRYGYGIKDKETQEDGPGVVILAEPEPLEPPKEEETEHGST